MSHLRSSLAIVIVALLLLAGCGCGLLGDCCTHHHAPVEHGEEPGGAAHHDQTPGGEGCQCFCHLGFASLSAEPVRVARATFVPLAFRAVRDEFPPDAVPRGIDYPPQLG